MSYTHKMVNGVEVPLTAEEIAEFEARDAEAEATSLDRAIAEIDARYEAKLAPVRDLILVAIAADGPNMDANIATLRADWQRIVAARSEELDALFLGV